MPRNHKVRIRRTPWGQPGGNPVPIANRHQKAIAAATRHHVTGHNGEALDPNKHRHDEGGNAHITWHLHGEPSDVQDMVNRWNGNSDGDNFPAFKPNVVVVEVTEE
jgi:hypothetical protein